MCSRRRLRTPASKAPCQSTTPTSDSPSTEPKSDDGPTLVPPESFEIGPGLFESLTLFPLGDNGYRYSFRLEVEIIVDAQRTTLTVDLDGDPFVFGVLPFNGPIDIDILPTGPNI